MEKTSSNSSLLERDARCIWHPYTQHKTAPPPLPIVRGEGTWLYTEDGIALLDAISSWWVNLHGHSHPYIAQHIARQAVELEHVIFSGFTHPPAVDLAEKLLNILPDSFSRIFYSDNGSTAVEIAIKTAIQYYHNQGEARPKVVAFHEAFHGETFGAMSVSGQLSLFDAFAPHLFAVERIPAPLPGREEESLAALETVLRTDDCCAFIFEPLIMGAGGMLMYEPAALDQLIECCRRHGVLTIADEVMTGFGRTGRIFACDYLSQTPDLICLAKGLTGGTLPLAVTACTEEIFQAFISDDKRKTFFHGHSYTANPLGCAAALASLELLLRPDCQERIAAISNQHKDFRDAHQHHPRLADIRCRGTVLALEFRTESTTSYFNSLRDELYSFFMERRILLRPLGNVVYVMPPYCMTDDELAQVYAVLKEALFGV